MRTSTIILASLLALVFTTVPSAQAEDDGILSAVWPLVSSVLLGSGPTMDGTVPGGARKVVLQHRTNAGWQRLRTATASDSGDYRIGIPTGWTTAHGLRIKVPATASHGALTSGRKGLTVKPRYNPKGLAWSHSLMKWRFDPCQPIRYKVYRKKEPGGGFKHLRRALRRVKVATGLRFKYVGRTRQVPFKGVGGTKGQQTSNVRGADFLFGWASPKQVPVLRGNTIGVGGPTSAASSTTGPKGFVRTANAMVAIDASFRAKRGFGSGYTRGELYMHEIGHALGMSHTAARTQVMAQGVALDRDRWGRGDLAGLRKVGKSAGCFPRISSRSAGLPQAPTPLE